MRCHLMWASHVLTRHARRRPQPVCSVANAFDTFTTTIFVPHITPRQSPYCELHARRTCRAINKRSMIPHHAVRQCRLIVPMNTHCTASRGARFQVVRNRSLTNGGRIPRRPYAACGLWWTIGSEQMLDRQGVIRFRGARRRLVALKEPDWWV